MLHLTDSHAHLTSPDLFDAVHSLVQNAQEANIKTIINICTDPLSLERGLALSQQYPWIYQVASTTPHDAEEEGESAFSVMAAAAREGLLKAVGETGLDYYNATSSPQIQKNLLRRYLRLALECQLPVVIHCRNAFSDFFQILDEEYGVNNPHAPGVLHCFTGTMQEAEEVLKRGWMISLSGIVTFKKSQALQEIAKEIPLDQLLIETDAPYLAPQLYRGKKNEPAYLLHTAKYIADLKKISLEELASFTTANACKLFRI